MNIPDMLNGQAVPNRMASPGLFRHEALPDIDIAITINGRIFLDRMSGYGEQSGRFIIERHFDAMGTAGFDVINFRCADPLAEFAIGGQLIMRPEHPSKVAIEMRASRWLPDPPSRASYSSAARDVFFPLLQAHNRQFGTRYRLRIAKVPSPFCLPRHAAKLFSRFCVTANKSGLHPLDWQRFYDFVRHARTEVPEGTLRLLLMQTGFSAAEAARLSDIYQHLSAFKKQRSPRQFPGNLSDA